MPLVSIVIPCRNEARDIQACVTSALSQEPPPGGIEIIVADGMSTDGTRDLLHAASQRDPRLRVIDNCGGIVSTGLNAAIRAAQGQVIVRLDAHTEYAPDYVARCLEALARTAADNVGGPARTKADSYAARAIAAAYHSPFSVGGASFHNTGFEGYVDTVTYGCWPRATFERFGYFDEELVRNQDDEHNLRITRGGGRVYQSPSIRSWYHPRGSLPALFKQYLQYGYWKVRVIQKHRLPASLRHLVPGAFVLSLAVLGLGAVFSALATWLLALECGVYLASVAGASIITAARNDWKLLPALPTVFACYHFGYGVGFLRGVWDFVLWRRAGSAALATLSR